MSLVKRDFRKRLPRTCTPVKLRDMSWTPAPVAALVSVLLSGCATQRYVVPPRLAPIPEDPQCAPIARALNRALLAQSEALADERWSSGEARRRAGWRAVGSGFAGMGTEAAQNRAAAENMAATEWDRQDSRDARGRSEDLDGRIEQLRLALEQCTGESVDVAAEDPEMRDRLRPEEVRRRIRRSDECKYRHCP